MDEIRTAERISISLEQAVDWMLDKLCEGEPAEVRKLAWSMFVTRLGFAEGYADFFTLSSVDDM